MKRSLLLLQLMLLCMCSRFSAQAQPASAQSDSANIVDRLHAQDWSSDINEGWLSHEGDDPAWSSPDFDDSQWEKVRLDDLGASKSGWRWYRLHLTLHENHPELALLLEGGSGTYALFLNGAPVQGPKLLSSFRVNRPIERVMKLDVPGTDLVIALRTHIPTGYAAWRLPPFMNATLGTPDAIENQRQALQSQRLYSAVPAIAINLALMFAGFGAFALYRSQRGHVEYFWLGLYLFIVGVADVLWYSQQAGLVPLSVNVLFADPLLFAATIAQIHFTFSFGGQRLGRAWRLYQWFLLIPVATTWLTWTGKVPTQFYMILEPISIIPVAVLLPILLIVWYRRGNREAGWLILPSLLPAATISLYDLGTLSIFFGWQRFDFLDNSIQIGPIFIEPNDLGNLLFLLASGIVIFFRFSRVARDQARSAAEFAAAREIQQRLVPASLPVLPGFQLEAAYLPAQEVGGDFYQVLRQADRSTLIVVGDVSGKGLKAAMTGALAIGALRTLAAEDRGPAELLACLNRQICDAQNDGFITCLCARIDLEGAVSLANAGHLSPYCNGLEVEVDPGLPLGLVADVQYSETPFQLAPGQTLTLISDGVVEASGRDGQLYGFDRTREISGQSAHQIAAAAQAFGQEDDITVLTVLRVSPARRA